MATTEEDFSFPATTTDSPPHFIESPPLWPGPVSPHDKPEKLKGKEVIEDEKHKKSIASYDDEEQEQEEEKMDILWENLNDECSKSSSKTARNCDVSNSPERGVQISCAKSLKLSRTNGQMFSGKKPMILVFIKVVKKVFLMQSRPRIKKRAW